MTNGAGLHHSYKHIFGVVNAYSAVTKAKNWITNAPEIELTSRSGGIDLIIPDDPDQTAVSTLSIGIDHMSHFNQHTEEKDMVWGISAGHPELE